MTTREARHAIYAAAFVIEELMLECAEREAALDYLDDLRAEINFIEHEEQYA